MREPHPSHKWWEIDEETRIASFCERCDICKCHGGEAVFQECAPTQAPQGFEP